MAVATVSALPAKMQGHQVLVTVNGATLIEYESLSLDVTFDTDNPQSATATYKQKEFTVNDAKGTLKTFLGSSIPTTDGAIIKPKDLIAIAVKELTSGDDLVDPDLLADMGTFRVLGVKYDIASKTVPYEITFESGFRTGAL